VLIGFYGALFLDPNECFVVLLEEDCGYTLDQSRLSILLYLAEDGAGTPRAESVTLE
jgi:hypothetical protein